MQKEKEKIDFKFIVIIGAAAIITAAVIITLIIIFSGGSEIKSEPEPDEIQIINVGLLTTTDGIKSNAAAKILSALKDGEFSKYIKVDYFEPFAIEDYLPGLESLARTGHTLIFCAGAELTEAVLTQAVQNSDICYVIMGYIPETAGELPENVIGVIYDVYEAVYLTGIIAANTTRTNKLGIIIGENTPEQNKYATAFYAGVLSENPEIEISGFYMTSFPDSANFAQSIANQMYSDRNDIIFSGAGKADIGVAVSAYSKNLYAICIDFDLSGGDMLESILVSAVIDYNIITHDLIRKYLGKEFNGGKIIQRGIKEGDVDIIIPDNEAANQIISENTINKTETAKQKIIDGSVKIPDNETDLLKAFPEINFMK